MPHTLGRHVSTTDAGGTVYHAYDGIHCVADLTPDGRLLRAYTWGAGVDNLLAVTLVDGAATNTLYAVTDPLGTVHALVDSGGTVAVSYTYDSWGNLLSVSGDQALVASLRFTWQGREYSYATGLYNFRARWYDPAAGRWLSKDPIGLEGGLNLYEAFGNNPVCFMDHMGMRWGINRNDRDRANDLFTTPVNYGTNILSKEFLESKLLETYYSLPRYHFKQYAFDTYFWDKHEKDVYWDYECKIYRGDDINYFGIGMYDAFYGNWLWWSKLKTIGWKLYNYCELPNDDVMFWLEYGYNWGKNQMKVDMAK